MISKEANSGTSMVNQRVRDGRAVADLGTTVAYRVVLESEGFAKYPYMEAGVHRHR